MQSNDNAPKLKQKATAKPSTSAADPKATAAAAAKAATSSTDSKQRTIVALVRGLHDTGIRDLQSLHRPLLEWEDRRVLPTCKSTPNTSNRTLHRQCGTEMAPHGSLPRLVINIESSDAMPADVLSSGNRNTLSPSPTPTRSLTPELNGDACSGSCSHHQEHSTTPNATRRFSHFNLALRRFSHIHVNNINRYGDSMGSLGHRAVLQYIDNNDISGLRAILDSRHLTIDDRDENSTTVLMVVAGRGLTSFVREFLARGADVQAEDLDNWTALLCATRNGHLDVVQLLLDHGADIEHRDMGGWTSLMWAAYRGHTDLVRLLLDKGADGNAHGNYHLGALLWAAGRGFKDIVELLVQRGAKVNVGDKYGTTALVWACRRGNVEIVDTLVKAGANVDTAGMYSWTPLLVAAAGGHTDCVSSLLEKKPNVNALDKDGMTALCIASREGFQDIAASLIAAGAYINIQDRGGDTPLIHAIKGGHRTVVEALLKKHADVDIQGKDRKTAIYTAVEKGHTQIVKLLLLTNPDLESSTKDGDTPLLRAVRNRNLEIVHMLLDRKAKVTASDKRGDTCLHIAMRARSKAIVEALLRNPKHSQLLYRANKAGETPYNIDSLHQKTILGQVFGARRLNTNEDSEGMLGYELYSSALADVLSEPTLTTPITVGLYAKWGSGKSFLLNKLREEMNNFAKQWAEPPTKTSSLLFIVCLHISLLIGTIVGLSTWSVLWGALAAIVFLVLAYLMLAAAKYFNYQMDMYWAYSVLHALEKRMTRLRLILQVTFCHPPGPQADSQPKPVRFHFAEASSASPTGDGAVAHMLAALLDAIESHYGWLSTRLYRAFRPKCLKMDVGWRWRRMCCLPIVLLFELGLITLVAGVALIVAYFTHANDVEREQILVAVYVIAAVLVTLICTHLHVLAKVCGSLFISHKRQLKRAVRSNENAPLTMLGAEVAVLTDMVKCLDAFTNQQSRLVGVIDALDSCDTERILTLLNAVQTLLSSPNRPFVLLISVDPHVIAKAAEANSRRLFTEGGIGGHDFLRNLVHLPVYLQNSGLRKVQRAQMTALLFKRSGTDYQVEDGPTLGHSVSARRLSNASEIMSSQEKLRAPHNTQRGGGGGKKLRLSESVASSIGSNLHRLGQNPQGVLDLSRIVLTDDYFSDVNPRSMRRLMNVIYITVRLLKAFQIDFSWYRLSSWINLTEQWPLRASMIVLHHDQFMDTNADENISLQSVYEKVRPKLACLREAAPLLELDRDERKLDAFLQLHKSDLLVADLRIFLPFTINLDPYLRKVLKEDQQIIEDEGSLVLQTRPSITHSMRPHPPPTTYVPSPQVYPPYHMLQNDFVPNELRSRNLSVIEPTTPLIPSPSDSFGDDILQTKLTDLTVEGVISLLERIEDLKPTLQKLAPVLRENAINGRVLKHCELTDLKAVLGLSFGHWELFRLLITTLRDVDRLPRKIRPQAAIAETPANVPVMREVPDTMPVPSLSRRNSVSHMEKQVTLEEQMICGALQTLNEEAFEDVASSERPSPSGLPTDLDLSSAGAMFAPTLLTSGSPIQQRRDSILKQQGSVKSEKRVSIKQTPSGSNLANINNNNNNNNSAKLASNVEYVSERQVELASGPGSSKGRLTTKPPAGPRPASLIITKNDSNSQFQLLRSTSIEYEDIEAQQRASIRAIRTTLLEQQEDESAPLVFTVRK
ncbi:kinase D-interacting substrate of 220 kDa isoform X2 [Drosophila hydei]|uniref:Kinase D-interacting substrate of 220 kDa isoform X2 n=1 Tax=Drosophila hydei TaxID=7224 RepID=A0A6J1L7A8_DROHY|nr:kinase D-interacting substrate of 220 kDa isoform X2 [Drosophila hydei]